MSSRSRLRRFLVFLKVYGLRFFWDLFEVDILAQQAMVKSDVIIDKLTEEISLQLKSVVIIATITI